MVLVLSSWEVHPGNCITGPRSRAGYPATARFFSGSGTATRDPPTRRKAARAQSTAFGGVHEVVGAHPVGRGRGPAHHALQAMSVDRLLARPPAESHGETLDVVRIDPRCRPASLGRPSIRRGVGREDEGHPAPREQEELRIGAQEPQTLCDRRSRRASSVASVAVVGDHLLVAGHPQQHDRRTWSCSASSTRRRTRSALSSGASCRPPFDAASVRERVSIASLARASWIASSLRGRRQPPRGRGAHRPQEDQHDPHGDARAPHQDGQQDDAVGQAQQVAETTVAREAFASTRTVHRE